MFIGHETTSCPVGVCRGDLACDPGKTQQAGVMMQPVTAWLSPFYLENTSRLPPNPLADPLVQMCHQLHAESVECCLKCSSLYTGRLMVTILASCVCAHAPREFRGIVTGKHAASDDGSPLRQHRITSHHGSVPLARVTKLRRFKCLFVLFILLTRC